MPSAQGFAHSSAPVSVSAQIKSAATGKYKKFYKARGYLPVWARGGTIGPAADSLIGLLSTADIDGLDPRDYDPEGLRNAVNDARAGTPGALGRAEMKLSKAFYTYVRDLRDPRAIKGQTLIYADVRLKPKRLTPNAVLLSAAIATSLDDYVQRSGWMNPIYRDLRKSLADFRSHWDALPNTIIPTGASLRAGNAGERVKALRHRLGMPDGARFDKALAWKVKVFQGEHGLARTGVVDSDTLAALNAGSSLFEDRIRLNLRRARLLPPGSERHILVNAADARLMMIADGRQQDSMRVVVGKPTEQTPMLAGMMTYAILNPYWNVPTDLVRDRVAPKVLAGQTFEGMHYEALADWTANARVLRPDEIDWKAVAAGSRELRVRMLPGGENWMGKIKFMFPNDLGIYLHDFPDKTHFKENDRKFSSGCVRLEDAQRLAKWLFGRMPQPSSRAPEQYVSLPKPVPVYITYLTVVPGEDGIAFLDDSYGRDGTDKRPQLARR